MSREIQLLVFVTSVAIGLGMLALAFIGWRGWWDEHDDPTTRPDFETKPVPRHRR
jgi:hypothetical protein